MEFEKRVIGNRVYEEVRDLDYYLSILECLSLILGISGVGIVLFDLATRMDLVGDYDMELYGLIGVAFLSLIYTGNKLEQVEKLQHGIRNNEFDPECAVKIIGMKKYLQIQNEVRDKIKDARKTDF